EEPRATPRRSLIEQPIQEPIRDVADHRLAHGKPSGTGERGPESGLLALGNRVVLGQRLVPAAIVEARSLRKIGTGCRGAWKAGADHHFGPCRSLRELLQPPHAVLREREEGAGIE